MQRIRTIVVTAVMIPIIAVLAAYDGLTYVFRNGGLH